MQPNETREQVQKKGLLKRPVKLWKLTLPLWLVVVAGCCILSFVYTGVDAGLRGVGVLPTYTPTPTPTNTPLPTSTPLPTNTPLPTSTPEPTSTPGPTDTPLPPTSTPRPEVEVRQIVHDALGSGNRDVQRVDEVRMDGDGWVHVKWAINDNLTSGMRRYGARLDVARVAEGLCKAGYCAGLAMDGTFSMVDQYGNVSESVVVRVLLEPETLARINWKNFLPDNIYDVADFAFVHPEFRD